MSHFSKLCLRRHYDDVIISELIFLKKNNDPYAEFGVSITFNLGVR